MVIAADHVSDLHQGIVYNDHVVVNRHSRRAQNDGIAHDLVGKLYRAVNNVMKSDRVAGNTQANSARFTGSPAALRLCRINRATLSGINWLAMFRRGAFSLVL